jgi:hypothetical protein
MDYKKDNNTVDEEDEESMTSTVKRGANNAHTRHQQRLMQVQQ